MGVFFDQKSKVRKGITKTGNNSQAMSQFVRRVLGLMLGLCLAVSLGLPCFALLVDDDSTLTCAAITTETPDEFCGSHQPSSHKPPSANEQKVCCKNPSSLEPCHCEAISSCQCLRDGGAEQAKPLMEQDKLATRLQPNDLATLGYLSLNQCSSSHPEVKVSGRDTRPDRPPR